MKVASPGLASLINALSGPFVTARDQPPAPGSNWLVRGWHSMRRLAGRCLEVLPKKTTIPILLVRLILVILAWAFILFVAIEVFFFWLMLVLPFVLTFRRKGNPPPPLSRGDPWGWGRRPLPGLECHRVRLSRLTWSCRGWRRPLIRTPSLLSIRALCAAALPLMPRRNVCTAVPRYP